MPKPRATTAKVTEAPKNPMDAPQVVVYKEEKVLQLVGPKALTVPKMMEFIGWEQTEDTKSAALRDHHNNAIQLWRNRGNRRVDLNWVKTLAQVILNNQWEYNRVPILIGKYGNVVSGQHRLLAGIIAEQMRVDPAQKDHWEEKGWKDKPVTIDVLLITGVEESGTFSRTVDYTRPSTDADVLYRDSEVFKSEKCASDRDKLCKIMGNAIRGVLWDRTGRCNDEYSPKLTHTEVSEFVRDHPSLEEAVRTVFLDNGTGQNGSKIAAFLPLGAAAGFLYLMGASTSDPNAYIESRKESSLDLQRKMSTGDKNAKGNEITETIWERACGFFHSLAAHTDRVAAVKKCMDTRAQHLAKHGLPAIEHDEKVSMIIRAWNRFVHLKSSEKLTLKDVQPKYLQDDDNPAILHLEEYPKVGVDATHGIDIGSSKDKDQLTSTDPEPQADDPEPDVLEEKKTEIREELIKNGGGAVLDESPEAERKRREAIEAASKPKIPIPAPKPSPASANQAAVNKRPTPKPKPVTV